MSNALYPTLAGLTWNTGKTPLFNTIIQRSVNFNELRGSFTSTPIYSLLLQYDLLRDDATYNELKTIMGFFLARQGDFDSFLYLDPDDSVALLQQFGTGDGATKDFQLTRSLGNFTEACANIGVGPTIYVNGVAKVITTDYTINSAGLVSFVAAPAGAAVITWSGLYYYRCRFNTENTPVAFNQFMSKLWELKQVELYGSLGTKI